MNGEPLKAEILDRLWAVADRHDFVRSVTVTGSFVDSPTLDGISDIDCVVVVDHLHEARYQRLVAEFDDALRGVLAGHGYDFRVNPTLGPLKFNGPKLAVLHLMLYSDEARVRHARQSPFTCLDWQRSKVHRKLSLAEVYPVFGLQPRHFLGARRGIQDYLGDLRAGTVSYRELVCTADGYAEKKLGKPMTVRDRHEFAYHVMRFLMGNLLKLLTRTNTTPDNEAILAEYFRRFPDGAETFVPFFRTLAAKKKRIDFDEPVADLESTLEAFAAALESQFRRVFHETSTRHVVVRHAPTKLNAGVGDAVIFQGRSDSPVMPIRAADMVEATRVVSELNPAWVYTSPATRARQTAAALTDGPLILDDRLQEIDYGGLEGLTVAQARSRFPEVFRGWADKQDPQLPDGESVADVSARVQAFARDVWGSARGATLTCTHNVVIRCLVGQTLGVSAEEWHRLRVPHVAPITFIQTKTDGLFVDIPEAVEAEMFAAWEPQSLRKAA
ncbi:histidine phosphatase family protein [Limnoglobus roseus]|uniref:Phosphoserine phosphatase 2 n=1 Tax=Limnoglobus roseus TaxID=2598579 RepID=A0A5C1APU4_9BACT|nr:histidine phosphatase family protein [Limnoglobus roseus]QEL20187.1 Putative phosphoserine phosphatase 2 [Limnoglobus roseus]